MGEAAPARGTRGGSFQPLLCLGAAGHQGPFTQPSRLIGTPVLDFRPSLTQYDPNLTNYTCEDPISN